jgi:hypothetical protein
MTYVMQPPGGRIYDHREGTTGHVCCCGLSDTECHVDPHLKADSQAEVN